MRDLDTELEQMRDFMRQIPFNQHLGILVEGAHEDGMTISCEMRPEFRNGHGVLHGGVIATLADVAVGVALKPHIAPRTATTIDLKVNFLKPVLEGKLWARCYLVRIGKTLITGRVELTDDAKNAVAIAIVSYMVLG
jgi:acyl-CoA thioesterase